MAYLDGWWRVESTQSRRAMTFSHRTNYLSWVILSLLLNSPDNRSLALEAPCCIISSTILTWYSSIKEASKTHISVKPSEIITLIGRKMDLLAINTLNGLSKRLRLLLHGSVLLHLKHLLLLLFLMSHLLHHLCVVVRYQIGMHLWMGLLLHHRHMPLAVLHLYLVMTNHWMDNL